MSGDMRRQNNRVHGYMKFSAARQLKESRQVNMSVEGKNCETLYFKHLSELINTSNKNKYNLALSIKKASPIDYAQRLYYKSSDNPFFHIQDIEDYNDQDFAKKFHGIIDEIEEAKNEFGIDYKLGYSNYTFELWILLHVADMKASVNHRNQYLTHINNHFMKDSKNKFKDLDEYKQEKNFTNILKKYITLDSVFKAIHRAEAIVVDNKQKHQVIEYKKIKFYKENPDTSVHTVVNFILNLCGVKEG